MAWINEKRTSISLLVFTCQSILEMTPSKIRGSSRSEQKNLDISDWQAEVSVCLVCFYPIELPDNWFSCHLTSSAPFALLLDSKRKWSIHVMVRERLKKSLEPLRDASWKKKRKRERKKGKMTLCLLTEFRRAGRKNISLQSVRTSCRRIISPSHRTNSFPIHWPVLPLGKVVYIPRDLIVCKQHKNYLN